MKSPLKSDHGLSVITNNLGNLRIEHSNNPWQVDKSSEWETFASFDPIVESSSSSLASDSSSTVLSSTRRVQWITVDEDEEEILCEEHENPFQYADVKAMWFVASDYKRFRSACFDDAMLASMDEDYVNYFQQNYEQCGQAVTPSGTHQFTDYRGLERAVFRQQLIRDKFNAISTIVQVQRTEIYNALKSQNQCEEAIADTSRKFSARARKMAKFLATEDRMFVNHGPEHSFIEI